VIAAVAGCGGPPKSNFPVPLFPGDGQATLASHRCQGGVCACRKDGGADDEEQLAVPEGKKRWELRLTSSPGPAWVVVDGQQLRKGTESTDACWYVDLAPGDRVVQLQGLAEDKLGVVGVSLTMNEYAPEKVAWYRGAFVSCGLPSGGCSVEELREIGQLVENDRRQLTDPCGTARVSGLQWRTGRVADGVHPGEVSMGFTLTVSGRVPEQAPEDPSCPVR
jgi:hypothetical protein